VQLNEELFTKFSLEILRCEEVCVPGKFIKMRKNEKGRRLGGLCH
jgi:hypothetical protein